MIGQHKKWSRRIKQKFKVPGKLWCRLSMYTAALQRCVVRKHDKISGVEHVFHRKPDISDYVHFHFYETVKFYESDSYPADMECFGKWLGPSKNVGSALCYQILKENGEIVDPSTVRKLTLEEKEVSLEKEKLEAFEKKLEECLGEFSDDTVQLLHEGILPANDQPHEDSEGWALEPEPEEEDLEASPPSEQENLEDDNLLSAEVIFP